MNKFRERRRVTVKVREIPKNVMTKQEPKADCDVNLILEKARRGIAPSWFNHRQPVFADVSAVPRDLTAAYEAVQAAEEAFAALPAAVRSSMDNDPRRLETWVRDPANLDVALKHGLVESAAVVDEDVKPAKGLKPSKAPKALPPAGEEEA